MSTFFQKDVDFIFGAANPADLCHPGLETPLPEWALAGRSNVGKSSLINALFNRKKLARVSHTPGRTRQINFFDCSGQCRMADLPGYGYARVSKADRRIWDALIGGYLSDRANLRLVLILIDARHPLKDIDREMMDFLDECAVAYVPVLTKTDKSKQSQITDLQQTLNGILRQHPAAIEQVFPVSAQKNKGLEDLRSFIVTRLSGS